MIPKNIKKENILKAISEIDRFGIPEGRTSRKFLLEFGEKQYPPKYVISLANRYANGSKLSPEEFSGGNKSNEFLRDLGFGIKEIQGQNNSERHEKAHNEDTQPKKYSHDERCRKCKETVHEMLQRIYGKVEPGYKLEAGTTPEYFRDSPFYASLKEIYELLQRHRGFKEFIKAKTLPNCDFFMPDSGLIVEFDESQHFTLLRKIALEHYPKGLELGFDGKKWIRLCETVDAKDNDPPYRDEQRAWYDTLRDFLPTLIGLKPTIRLHAGDFRWCSLNPNKSSDTEEFKKLLKNRPAEWEIAVKGAPSASIGRIIIKEPWEGNPEEAKHLLQEISERWPKDQKVKFLITCGGFIQFEWPKSITWKEVEDNKTPNEDAVNALIKEAEECARQILNDGLAERLKEITDFITLGVDSYKEKISMTQSYISELHIEIVFLVNLKTKAFYWTGKSYPTPGQQHGLVRITDMRTHFVNVTGIGKVMMLGCHDLTMFNNRNMDNTGEWRKGIKKDFRKLAEAEKPLVVLHHPHTTVTTGTWRNGWSTVNNILPSVKQYAGAGRYYEPDRKKSEYSPLNKVLEATQKGGTIDLIIRRIK